MFDYLKFYKTLTSLSDDDECTLTEERKVTEEEKCSVYHAVFKSRVDRFPKIRVCYKRILYIIFFFSLIYLFFLSKS